MSKKNIYLFQPQYTMNFQGTTQNWLPYSAGCLWAYAIQHDFITENFHLDGLFFARDKIAEVLEKMEEPVVAGFSSYVWNEQYNLHMSHEIKKKFPDCKIVFGGPQVNKQDLWDYPWIDIVMLSEGEKQFTQLLKDIHEDRDLQNIYMGQRITDLTELPSPFTTGVFDKIIADNPEILWQTPFETSRGCPFSCTFCDWGSLTYSKVKQFEFERLEEEVLWIKNNPIAYIFMADANFGIFKDRDVELAKMFHKHLDDSRLDKINIQFAKNSNDHVIQIGQALGRLGKGITLSQQSMSETTLEEIKRKNLDINKLGEMLEKTEEANLDAYSEMIIGLPGETLESWKTGMGEILEAGQHNCVEVWYAQTLKNSEMSTPESREKYGIQTVLVKDYIFLYNDPDDIPEYVEVVCATKDMSTEEMVEAYMYSWMIVRFHVYGYTYLLSRYARRKGISYREFYDKIFEKLSETKHIDEHFQSIRRSVSRYLTEDQSGKDAGKGWFKLRKNVPDHRQVSPAEKVKPQALEQEQQKEGRGKELEGAGGHPILAVGREKISKPEEEKEERAFMTPTLEDRAKGNSNIARARAEGRYDEEEKNEKDPQILTAMNEVIKQDRLKKNKEGEEVESEETVVETESAHAWLYQKETDFVEHKLEIYDIAWKALQELLPDTHTSIMEMQKAYMFDPSHKYPFTVKGKMDYHTFEETDGLIEYEVHSNMTAAGGTYDNRRNRHPAKNTLINTEEAHGEEIKLAGE